MKRVVAILMLCGFLIPCAYGDTIDPFEKGCKRVFDSPAKWRSGNSAHPDWQDYCWDYVEKQASNWKWVGNAESRRKAAEKKRKEDERRRKEAERRKKEEERRLAEIKRKRLEAEAEAERKRLAEERLAKEREERRKKVLATYKDLPFSEVEQFLANSSDTPNPVIGFYVGHLFNEYSSEFADPLEALQKVVQRAKNKGISLAHLKYAPLKFLERKKAVKEGDGEDTFDVRFDLAGIPPVFRPDELSTETIKQEILNEVHQYFVLVNVHDGVIDRNVTNHQTIASEYKVGENALPNPRYSMAQLETEEAYAELREGKVRQRQCSGICQGVSCFVCLAWIGKIKGLRADYEKAKSRLRKTPMTISKPVYQPYEFKKNEIRVEKQAVVEAFVFGKQSELLSVRNISHTESETFSLIYGLHQKDKNRSKHTSGISTEQEVSRYEIRGVTLKFDGIFHSNRVIDGEIETGTLIGEVLDGLNSKIGRLEGKDGGRQPELPVGTATDNARFQSVVIVLHPEGSIGSGFYVSPDVILTNYHVIEGTKFLEIVTFDGAETFGKVIGKDIRLDLALIKVQQRGPPVTLFEHGSFSAGATVDAIGHPQGLEFSLTRGIVSGVRRLPSLYDPGGKPVRFIQSDVAINPGNSGGPLFLANKVVGVNDWKLAKTEVEGLSFSIHVSEVKKFLKKYGL